MRVEDAIVTGIDLNRQNIGKDIQTIDKDRTLEINFEQNINDERKHNEEKVIKTIELANKEIEVYNRRLQFSIHEKTKEIMVKVIDANTDEVIREIPPEKILDMVAKMCELVGLFVDEKI